MKRTEWHLVAAILAGGTTVFYGMAYSATGDAVPLAGLLIGSILTGANLAFAVLEWQGR